MTASTISGEHLTDGALHQDPASVADRRRTAIELGVVLLFLVPRLAMSFVSTPDDGPFFARAAFAIAGDVGLFALFWLLVRYSGERLADIGMVRLRWREVAIGAAAAAPTWFVVDRLQRALHRAGLASPPPHSLLVAEHTIAGFVTGIVLAFVIAATEEMVFRGYLMTRFAQVTGRWWFAGIASAAIFTLGHGYEGAAAFVAIGVFAVFVTALALWRRSLTAAIVLHFVFDALAIVVVPLLR
jgi:CAAX protease family protein